MYTRSLLILALTFGTTGLAAAQEISDTGGRVFGLVGGSFGEGGTTVTTSGGAGLRLTRHLGLDFEVLYVSDLDLSDDDDFVIQGGGRRRVPFPSFRIDEDGSLTTFLTKLTVDFPLAGDRLVPYVTGGGGIGRLSRRTEVRFGDSDNDATPIAVPFDAPQLVRLIFPPVPVDRSAIWLALTVGGGGDVMLWKGLGVGADVRWLRLLTDRDELDVAIVAGRVSYRF